ncbi:hypothetical protein SDC9_49340 [bioreactor metagenome]|uniref:Uncharacterized protein n=1 Tax=bioreactor metagenome TaxID=1076179 RepID=A0A644WHY1_9ZZZZ
MPPIPNSLVLYPKYDTRMTSAEDFIFKEKFPFKSVTVPTLVPFRTTETPTMGSLLTSLILPVIFITSSTATEDGTE